MIQLAPSILSSDFSQLKEAVQLVENGGAHLVHIDVMDGHFVPNLTFGPPVVKSIRKHTKLPFDVHLMMNNPEQYIKDFYEAGADIITVHAEVCIHLHRTVQLIKEYGMKAGIALNPATDFNVLKYILPETDRVLIMSVNPGFGGQRFIPECFNKIKQLSHYIKEQGLQIKIEVDGGVSLSNAEELIKAGTDILVAGSAVYNTPDPIASIKNFLNLFKKIGEEI